MYNFDSKSSKVQMLTGNIAKSGGLAGIGAGIGAIREIGILRNKINKKYGEECAKADAAGKPRPPRPDTSTKTLMALLKGSIKGAVVGTAVGFIPGVGKGLKDTVASLGAGMNKFRTGNMWGANVTKGTSDGTNVKIKTFSFLNTFLPTREFSDSEKYTLQYLTDKDFAAINLSNLDIGEVTELDLYKMFFSLADAAGKSFTRQELQEYFSRKIVKDNSKRTAADEKLAGMGNAAMPVLGALAGGGWQAIKARKRALQQWENECKIADAKGLPRPPKPSILTLAGDVAKGAAIGAGAGWIGSKIAPGANQALSQSLSKFGLISKSAYNKGAKIINKDTNVIEAKKKIEQLMEKAKTSPLGWKDSMLLKHLQSIVGNGTINEKNVSKAFSVTFSQYKAALARKGQHTTLTEEQFNNCSPEYYEILIRNMQPINFDTDLYGGTDTESTMVRLGTMGSIGSGIGLIVGCLKAGEDYKEYKAKAEAQGEKPISKIKYIAMSKQLPKYITKGAGEGIMAGAKYTGGLLLAKGIGKGINKLRNR